MAERSRAGVLSALIVAATVVSVAAAPDALGQGSDTPVYNAQRLAEVLPYSTSRRVEAYQVMRELARLSHISTSKEVIKDVESDAFPELPRIVLLDTDGDETADYFVYHTVEGPSDLYAAFFPLIDGGPPAWIVFPAGPVIDDNKELLFLLLHWVDQNSDGKADLIVFEDVDLNQSGLPESGMSAWLADDDFDGRVETAMQCQGTECTKIDALDGTFDLKLAYNPGGGKFKAGAPFVNAGFLELLFSDLRHAMGS